MYLQLTHMYFSRGKRIPHLARAFKMKTCPIKLPSLYRRGGPALRAGVVVQKNQINPLSSPPYETGVPARASRSGVDVGGVAVPMPFIGTDGVVLCRRPVLDSAFDITY